jgi:integral membrane protein
MNPSKPFQKNALRNFRMIALAEGISFLLLLFIAMPLKYAADLPDAVKYTGWAHGLLFVLYLIFLLIAAAANRWSYTRCVLAFLVSLIPFGTFWFDKQLKAEEASLA